MLVAKRVCSATASGVTRALAISRLCCLLKISAENYRQLETRASAIGSTPRWTTRMLSSYTSGERCVLGSETVANARIDSAVARSNFAIVTDCITRSAPVLDPGGG